MDIAKKRFGGVISVIIVACMVLCGIPAIFAGMMLGDADINGTINIRDATVIQKFAAELCVLDGVALKNAEVTGDGRVNIRDATLIQRYCANLVSGFMVTTGSVVTDPTEQEATVTVPATSGTDPTEQEATETVSVTSGTEPTEPCVTQPATADLRTLYQSGGDIINGRSQTVQLLGVNIPQFGWALDGDGVNAAGESDADHLTDIAVKQWGSNIIRLAVTPSYWLNGGERFKKFTTAKEYRDNIDRIISRVVADDAYVLLDCHTYYGPSDAEVAFWTDAARHYKDNPGVIFGVINEPVSDWNTYFNGGRISTLDGSSVSSVGVPALIRAIRATGAKNLISVGGIDWAYDVSEILRDDLLKNAESGGNGMIIEIHPYSNKPNVFDSYWDSVEKVAEQYPVLIGECGPTYRDSNQSTGLQDPLTLPELNYLNLITSKLDSNGYHMTAWAMGAWPFLYQTDRGITAYGEYIRDWLLSHSD